MQAQTKASEMKRSGWLLLTLLLMAARLPAAPEGKNGALVERWAEGLSAPQGLALDAQGSVYVVENGAGRVRRFARDGKESGTFAEGLKAPSWALFVGSVLYVAEREGNSIAEITEAKTVSRLAGEVVDPLGLSLLPGKPDRFLVVSHRQSLILPFVRDAVGLWSLQSTPVAAPSGGTKYGWRDIAVAADGTLYVTDEISGAILSQSPGGGLRTWKEGLKSPSGLAFSPSGALLVTEEANGRLSRFDEAGKAMVLAEGLGKAREALFLDERTVLVSDREGGIVWKVTLPQ